MKCLAIFAVIIGVVICFTLLYSGGGEPRFAVENLSIAPEEVGPGGDVVISVDVANVDTAKGMHTVELKIDGEVVDNKIVTLAPGESQTVSFTVSREALGVHIVYIDDLTGSFTVSGEVELVVRNFVISPGEVEPGDDVIISVDVANIGENSITHTVEFKIGEELINSEDVVLNPGEFRKVSFTVSKEEPGSYEVGVNGLTGSFEVWGRMDGITLRFWNDKTAYTEEYEEIFQKFTDLTGVGITVVPYYDIEMYRMKIKQLAGTPDGPDLFTWWTGKTMEALYNMDVLMPVDFAWDDTTGNPEEWREKFTYDGKTYGTISNVAHWLVFYDKSVFADVGVDPPETWNEFLEVCRKLKAAGKIPIYNGWASWQGFIWPTEILVRMYPDYYEALNSGYASYTDPKMKEAFGIITSMNGNGYFGEPNAVVMVQDPTVSPETVSKLVRNEAGMQLYGDWLIGAFDAAGYDDWGMFLLPNVNPDLEERSSIIELGPILANNGTTHPDAVRRFLRWWCKTETVEEYCRIQMFPPWNEECSTDFLPEKYLNFIEELESMDTRELDRYWEAAPTMEYNVRSAFVSGCQEILCHPDRLDSVLETVQVINEMYWEHHGGYHGE